MGKAGKACFDIVSCGRVSADHDDVEQSESSQISKKRRWSFRKRSSHHRLLSTTVISVPLPLNKETEEDSVKTSDLTENPFTFENFPSPKKADDNLPPPSKTYTDTHESAATVIQGSIRRYLSYKESHKLKSVVKLQAFIRGYLVRRLATGTLRCVLAIVKMQALVRARLLQQSSSALLNQEGEESSIVKEKKLCSSGKMLKSRYVRQMLDSTPKTKPIHVTCDHSKSDSAWKWLERWMTLSTPDVAQVEKENPSMGADVVLPDESIVDIANDSETKKSDLQFADEPQQQTNDFGKTTSGESLEEEGKKYSSFALVQAKFEELCSLNSQKSVNAQEVSNTIPDPVKSIHVAASDCGTEISISSTLDSPDRSENEGAGEIVLEIQSLERKDHQEQDLSLEDSPKTEDPTKTEIQENGMSQTDENSVNSKKSKRGRNPLTKKQKPPIPVIINNTNYPGKRRESLENGISENGESNELQPGGGKSLPSYMQATKSARAKVNSGTSPKSSPDIYKEVNGKKRHSLPLVNGKLDSSPRMLRSSPSSSSAERRWQR